MQKTRRVLFLDAVPFIGGAENSMLELARRLPARGWQPLVGVPAEGALSRRCAELGVPVAAVDLAGVNLSRKPRLPLAIGAVARLIRRERIDLVHVNSLPLTYLAPAAARIARRPCVLHARDLVDAAWVTGKAARPLRWVDRVLCISRAVHAPFAPLGAKAALLYNGVDLSAFASVRGESNGPPAIGILGYVIPRKGHEELIEAVRLLRDRHGVREFTLHVYGEDPEPGAPFRTRLEEQVRQAALEPYVRFEGFRTDVAEAYRSLDVVTMPSWEEPFGRVLIEAAAAGLPVVACATGGAPEIVEQGRSGFLVPPRDPAALAEALARLCGDPDLRRRMGAAGRGIAAERFDIDAHVDRVAVIYDDLTATGLPADGRDVLAAGAGDARA